MRIAMASEDEAVEAGENRVGRRKEGWVVGRGARKRRGGGGVDPPRGPDKSDLQGCGRVGG